MSDSSSTAPVFLVDASIYIFQSHFSPYVECFDTRGEDLSAVYGFAQFLLQFLARNKPTHLAVAHDESLFCGFRHKLCPDYKSNRELPDDNLAMQLKACIEICQVLGLPSFASQEYEADDIIGTLASRCRLASDKEQEGEAPAVHIVSRDKDLGQLLLTEEDCVWDYNGNKRRFRSDIVEEFGVQPQRLPDYLGLVGDSVDCITGVPGVGPVKARELLGRYECLESLYDHLDEVAGLPIRGAAGLARKLKEHRELAELSKLLATIVCDIETAGEACAGVALDDLALSVFAEQDLQHFLSHYRFDNSATRRIRNLAGRLAG